MRHKDAYYAMKALDGCIYATGLLGMGMAIFPKLVMPVFEMILYKSRGISPPYDSSLHNHNHFVYGIAGAVMTGWAVSLHFAIRTESFRRGERGALWSILGPICVWYVLDSSCSLVTDHWPNVVFNTICAAGFGIPLLVLRKYFDKESKQA